MAISNSVQFRGEDQVLAAYQKRNVPAWALFCNKQFLFKYEGKSLVEGLSQLREYLNMMSDSVAVLTLCVYEDLPAKAKIKSNTACDGSFNFTLNTAGGAIAAGNGGYALLLEQLKKERDEYRAEALTMQARVEELEDNEEKQSGGFIGAIKEAIMPHLGSLLQTILQPPHYSNIQASGAIGNAVVPGDNIPVVNAPVQQNVSMPAPASIEITEQELERVGAAYAMLRSNYSEILPVLEKLAGLCVNDPAKFKLITSYFSML